MYINIRAVLIYKGSSELVCTAVANNGKAATVPFIFDILYLYIANKNANEPYFSQLIAIWVTFSPECYWISVISASCQTDMSIVPSVEVWVREINHSHRGCGGFVPRAKEKPGILMSSEQEVPVMVVKYNKIRILPTVFNMNLYNLVCVFTVIVSIR